MNDRLNIVLVHGAWADGSSWSSVIEQLQAEGYHVTAPQFALTAMSPERSSQLTAAEAPSDSRKSGRTRP
jgi:hypothetical protein